MPTKQMMYDRQLVRLKLNITQLDLNPTLLYDLMQKANWYKGLTSSVNFAKRTHKCS